ncbi:MAG: hypothetical protein AB7P49_02070 [Bdellovibrionales bacterium]
MQSGIFHNNCFYPDPSEECALCMRPVPVKGVYIMHSSCCRRRSHIFCFMNSAWARDIPQTTPCPACLRQTSSSVCQLPNPPQTGNTRLLKHACEVFGLCDVYESEWMESLGMGVYESGASLASEDDRLVRYATQKETGEHLPTDYSALAARGFPLGTLLSVFPSLSAAWIRSLSVKIDHMVEFARCIKTLSARYGRATNIYRGVFYGLAPQIFAGQTIKSLAEYGVYAEDLLGMGLTPAQMDSMGMHSGLLLSILPRPRKD